MPFTFSHPAIVIQLSKSEFKFSLTGLLFGSIAPDFEFYFRMKLVENVGHQWYGVLIFDFPLALLLAVLYHNIVRNLLVNHLPIWFKERLSTYNDFDFNSYALQNKFLLSVSIFLGIVSHLLWDGFTHHDGIFVELIPFLKQNISLLNTNIALFDLFQVLGSIWGLWFVYNFIKKMPIMPYKEVKIAQPFSYWSILTILSICIIILRIILMPDYNTPMNLLFASIGSAIYALLIVSIFMHKIKTIFR